MAKVWTGATMSLDGFIAGPNETGFDYLFEWYSNGDVVMPTTHVELTFRLTTVSADHLRAYVEQLGALVVGRKLFDVTSGWGGRHPLDRPVVVLTHRPPTPDEWPHENAPFTFVTDGIESAIDVAKSIAGDRTVGANGGTIARQCLNAGLLDEVWIDLAPVLLGAGTPFFDQLTGAPIRLDGPISIAAGKAVTHLRYAVSGR